MYKNDFIWREDHMAYHMTGIENIDSIKSFGLIPSCGDRSKYVGDIIKGVYFSDSLIAIIEQWADLLYGKRDRTSLEILRFNLKGRKWITHAYDQYPMPGDCYLVNKVKPCSIDYLRILHDGILEHATSDNDLYYKSENQVWLPITEYDRSK